jgi:3-phosphoshikimate 1-carboxyvinyltransferase
MTAVLLSGHRRNLRGTVDLPASKSLTNRALVAAAVAGGGTIVSPLDCDDTRVLAVALEKAGWAIVWDEEIEVGPRVATDTLVELDLRDSGTGSRLMLGLLAATPGRFLIDGSPRLRERPMTPLLDTLSALGAGLDSRGGRLPVDVAGSTLEGGSAKVRPEISSQFVSSLVMAAPLMGRGLDLEVSGPLPSSPYLDLTSDVLRAFGGVVEVSNDRRRWVVAPQPLKPSRFAVEGDWSAAAFILAAVAVAGGEVDIGPLDSASRQGDRAVVRILADAGLEVDWNGDRLIARGPVTMPLLADLRHTPDLFPALATVAACAPPGSRFAGLEHLKHKESDRLAVMVENLERLGARIAVRGFEFTVEGTIDVPAGSYPPVTAAKDHRIAMAAAVAALAAGPLALDDPDCVAKSFPQFWQVWDRLLADSDEGRKVP